MVKCDEIIQELEMYRRNQISADLKSIIDDHLNTCLSCRRELDSLKQLDELLGQYQATPVTAGFTAGFFEKLAKEEAGAKKYFNLSWRRLRLIASAAVILIGCAVWIINYSGNKVAPQENEIINNLELLEDLETSQIIDYMADDELVEAFPEIMDVDLNGH
jgi:anti-sigma factor RsiW